MCFTAVRNCCWKKKKVGREEFESLFSTAGDCAKLIKKQIKFCKVCAHFLAHMGYNTKCNNPPIHYIVFAYTPKEEIPSLKRQL